MHSNSIKKALVVAAAALVLPVLGASSAYAGGNADEHGKSAGKGHAQSGAASHGKNDSKSTAATSTSTGHGKGSETDKSGSSANPGGTFQGKSSSTPDQDGKGMNRGADNNDKTGPGTDGNNGCGNEPRLAAPRDGGRPTDDDNNGWCGSKTKPERKASTPARAAKPASAAKPSKASKPAKAQPERADKPAKAESSKGAKPAKAQPERGGKPAKDESAKPAKPVKADKPEKAGKPAKDKAAAPGRGKNWTNPKAAPRDNVPTQGVTQAPAVGPIAGPVLVAAPAPQGAVAPRAAKRLVANSGVAAVVVGPPTGLTGGSATVAAQSAVAPTMLPFTGAPVALLLLLAGLAVGVGAVLLAVAARRTA